MAGPIRRLLLKHPSAAFIDQAKIDREWEALHYIAPPDFDRAVVAYAQFVDYLRTFDIGLHFLSPDPSTTLDAIYTHDPVLVTKRGAVLCNMGKAARQTEPRAIASFLQELEIPILGAITDPGRLEGGDVVWLDERTLAVGEGYRTNAEGIRQLRRLLGDLIDDVISVSLPHWDGPTSVLHLMSILSPVDADLAVAYSRLMPVPFRSLLLERGMTLVEVPEEEFPTMACNVLAVAPRRCVMVEGNPRTKRLLEAHGATVWTYPGDDISRKGEGGPTCLTRPLLRV